jgi:hypothetical protein
MKRFLLSLTLISLTFPAIQAEDRDDDRDNDRSSALTPTAQRPRNMANPEIPGWQAVPHGK